MRILITGAAGFLGSHLVDYFIKRGDEVVGMDNLITGNVKNIDHIKDNDKFVFYKYDVSNYIYVTGEIDYILHFASPASPVDYLNYPIQTLKVGSLGTHNALGLAKAKNAKFLLASTSEVYGDPLINPQTEDYWGNVNPIGIRGVYDESKRFAESMTMAYHRYHNLNTRIVRIFNTYGPRMRLNDGRVIPNFISQALDNKALTVYGDGSQTRSFCYVSDLIEGIARLMDSDYHLPVNMGNPEEMKIIDFANKVIKETGCTAGIEYKPLPQDDPKRRKPNIDLAKQLLGWEPKVSLDEGLKKTIEHFKKEKEAN